jgi:hypothetical protein
MNEELGQALLAVFTIAVGCAILSPILSWVLYSKNQSV